MGWFEQILSAIQNNWGAVTGIFGGTLTITAVLSWLKTKREVLKAKIQNNNLANIAIDLKNTFEIQLKNAVSAIEEKSSMVLESQSADMQAFIDAIINSPDNAELRAKFELRKNEITHNIKAKLESKKEELIAVANELKEEATGQIKRIKKSVKEKLKEAKKKAGKITQAVASNENIVVE